MIFPYYILRSPGSKCWFIRHARNFLRGQQRPNVIVEPFAGSAVVSLTLMSHGFANRVVLAERNPSLRTYWETALGDAMFARRVFEWAYRARAQRPDRQSEFVAESIRRMGDDDPLCILLRTLMAFNGIVKGRSSVGSVRPLRNWLPLTLDTSLALLYEARQRIELFSDGFDALERADGPDTYAFVDPPYTTGKNSPGHKLYEETEIDHQALLQLLGRRRGTWQLTAELCPDMLMHLDRASSVLGPIQKHRARMRNSHGHTKVELVISKRKGNGGAKGL